MSNKDKKADDKKAPAATEAATAPPAASEAQAQQAAAAATETLSPEQIAELKEKAAKADENWNRLLRTAADFDNYRKRAAREKQEAVKYANSELVMKLIPVLDNFEMALAAARTGDANNKSLQDGIGMVHQQLKTILAEAGLVEIDATGQPFDPNLHEAVGQEESAEIPEGHVLKQWRKGYRFQDRLLRPATVVVAKKPAG